MKLKRLGLPDIIALSVALLMVIAGLVISRVGGGPEAVAAQDAARPGAVVAPAPAAEAVEPSEAETPPTVADPEAAEPKASEKPQKAAAPAAAPKRKVAPKVSATRSLPPLPPPEWGASAAVEEPSGPPPGVLWLSGVIQGEQRVAVLRRGESRYVVREGETFEGTYRVVAIGSNSVTLERGGKKQTLRVGQY